MGQVGPLDLQRGKVWECRRVDRPHTGTIVSKYHQLSVQTETAANCGSISSWVYCLVNECFFSMSQPWMCSPQLSLIVSLCFYRSGLSPMRSPRIHLPSIDISISGYPVCVCVLGWIVCRALAPCLFYLVWRVVALQNKRPQVEALLCKWALLFIFISVWK